MRISPSSPASAQGKPAAAIATVTVHPAGEGGSEDEYLITPFFVSVVPGMRLTGHDGREP